MLDHLTVADIAEGRRIHCQLVSVRPDHALGCICEQCELWDGWDKWHLAHAPALLAAAEQRAALQQTCARCDSRGALAENSIWCAGCLEWWREEYAQHDAAELKIDAIRRERDALAAALDDLCESAKMHRCHEDEQCPVCEAIMRLSDVKQWRDPLHDHDAALIDKLIAEATSLPIPCLNVAALLELRDRAREGRP